MKWGFKMSKEKEEQTPEAVAEEVTEEAESIEEEAKESFEAEPMEDTSEESSETEPTEDTSEQNSETESSENESEENSETEKKQGFFSRLVAGLTKTRDSFVSGIDSIFSGFSSIDDDFYEEIEEILIMGDIGVRATQEILENLQQKVKENHIKQPEECKELLIQSIKEQMEVGETAYRFEHEKSVVLVVGVNGVGKTTSVGKLAGKLKAQGRKVVLAAADTFRAAAVEQLVIWSERVGVPIVKQKMGSDPASVAFDTLSSAKANGADVVIIDTAGRLHNKINLMNELTKIKNVMKKVIPDAPPEVLLVLDGSTGQNAFEQAKQFTAATEVNALAVTKLDGTAKGGVVIGISDHFRIPVKYIGLGEGMEDLQVFNKKEFVNSLFGE